MQSYLCRLGAWPDIDASACPISAEVLPLVQQVLSKSPEAVRQRAQQRRVYIDVLSGEKGVIVSCREPSFGNLTTSSLSAERILETCKKCGEATQQHRGF